MAHLVHSHISVVERLTSIKMGKNVAMVQAKGGDRSMFVCIF